MTLKDRVEIGEKVIKTGAILVVGVWAVWKFGAEYGIDARRPFLEKQMAFCIEASTAAALVAVTEVEETYERNRESFLKLFYGPLAIVENLPLAQAMVAYRDVLVTLEFDDDRSVLNTPSIEIAHQCRELVQASWRYEAE